jgi:hypothetical protein
MSASEAIKMNMVPVGQGEGGHAENKQSKKDF